MKIRKLTLVIFFKFDKLKADKRQSILFSHTQSFLNFKLTALGTGLAE